MLQKLYEVVPNVDTERNVIAGFSNGGHSIACIFENGNEYLTSILPNVIMCEGGFALTQYGNFEGSNVLFMYGGKADGGRAKLHEAAEKLVDGLERSGANVSVIVMEDTGHAMPKEFFPQVKEWVLSVTEGESTEEQDTAQP
jgi:predicted esterase